MAFTRIRRKARLQNRGLTNMYSRVRTLFYGAVWYESDFKHIEELWGKNLDCFLLTREPDQKLHCWYNQEELSAIYAWVTRKLNTDHSFFELAKKRFFEHLNPMLPYMQNKQSIQTMGEFKQFYAHWLHWWSPMDSILLFPDFEKISDAVKAESLQIQEKTQECRARLDSIFQDFFTNHFPSYEELAEVILPSEFFELEKRGLTPAEIQRILERKKGCAIFRENVFPLVQLPAVLKKENLFLEGISALQGNTISGMSAFPGNVWGKVRVLLRTADFPSFVAGEILVSEMTSPVYLPLISKAAAVITDEGGIGCHAAISAREMKKPCVVGTKNATKHLKTGDWIEVDADRGIVRVLTPQPER